MAGAETIGENKHAGILAESLGMSLEEKMRHNRFFCAPWWQTVIYTILKHEAKKAELDRDKERIEIEQRGIILKSFEMVVIYGSSFSNATMVCSQ